MANAHAPTGEGAPPLGWGAALAGAVLGSVAMALLFLFIPQVLLTELSGPSREARVWLVTAWEASAFIALAWAGYRWSRR